MCHGNLLGMGRVPESACAETFLPDSDDEGESGAPAPVESAPKMLEDSDDEAEPTNDNDEDSDSDEEEAPNPSPPPAPTKKARKVVRKKKTGN